MELHEIGTQLRKPAGELGIKVGLKMNEGNKWMNQCAIQSLNVQPHEHILEIGMGNGFFVSELMRTAPSAQYTGCDFSDIMIEEACRLNEPLIKSGRVHFILSPSLPLPFPDAFFDACLSVNTLYFWADPSGQLTEIRRVLKPKGQLILSFRPERIMRNLPFVDAGFTLYTPEAVAALLEQNGFRSQYLREYEEPSQELQGHTLSMASVVTAAEKI